MGKQMNELEFYDVIGQDIFGGGITAASVKAQLEAMGEVDEITVRINSPGGDVFDGLAIFNLLKEHPAKINVKVDGYAASIASVIAMAGDSVVMGVGSQVMIHNPWTFAMGEAKDFTKMAEILDGIKGGLIEAYQERVDADTETLSAWMDEEKWMGSEEAIAFGFATATTSTKAKVSNMEGFRWINKAPQVEEVKPEPLNAKPQYVDYLKQSLQLSEDRAVTNECRKTLKV
jgi:ATP-dependent protease ClpP protease subunit